MSGSISWDQHRIEHRVCARQFRIDWGVHLGGFVAGLIACAVLDVIEKAILRAALQVSGSREGQSDPACLCRCILGMEQPGSGHHRDGFRMGPGHPRRGRMLCHREGRRSRALHEEGACCRRDNAGSSERDRRDALRLGSGIVVHAALADRIFPLDNFLVTFCPNPVLISGLVAIGAAAVTLWLCSKEMSRGIEDVGFVGTSLRAERNRRHGL